LFYEPKFPTLTKGTLEHPFVKSPSKTNVRDDCVPLKHWKTFVETRKAIVELKRGQVTGETKFLQNAEEILQKSLNEISQVRYNTAQNEIDLALICLLLGKAKVLHAFFVDYTASNAMLETFWQAANLSFSGINESNQKNTNTNVCYSLLGAREMLLRAMEHVVKAGSAPRLTKEICQTLALLTGNCDPCATAFYISYGLGVTLRHEILSLLSYKLLKLEKKQINSEQNALLMLNSSENQNVDESIEALVEKTENINLSSIEDNSIINRAVSAQQTTTVSNSFNYYKELFSFQNESTKRFQEEYVDILPNDWTVCLLTVTSDHEYLLIVRLQRETLPITIKIDLTHRPTKFKWIDTAVLRNTSIADVSQSNQENEVKRRKPTVKSSKKEAKRPNSKRQQSHEQQGSCKQNRRSANDINEADSNIFSSIQNKFATIMKSNQETTNLTSLSRESMSEKEKMEWWQKRETADQLLREILDHDIETILLGPWKVLLMGTYRDEQTRCELDQLTIALQKKLEALSVENGTPKEVQNELVSILVNGMEILSDDKIREWNIYFVGCKFTELSAAQTKLLNDSVKILRTEQKQWIERCLSNRIQQSSSQISTKATRRDQHVKESSSILQKRNPVILVLDGDLQTLPWENMSFLRNHPVSRVPSLNFIRARVLQHLQSNSLPNVLKNGIDSKKICYILNPSGDLKNAEEELAPLFKQQKWVCIARGKPPTTEQIENALTTYDLLIYCGHNGGEQYISRKRISELSRKLSGVSSETAPLESHEQLLTENEEKTTLQEVLTKAWSKQKRRIPTKPKTNPRRQNIEEHEPHDYINYIAASMLMGCRSAQLSPNGEYEPDGLALAHLVAGSLTVIGNLWTVTDGDLDELTKAVLNEWLNHRDFSLLDAIASARSSAKMKLKYLNGAALVCYGFPLYHKDFIDSRPGNLK
jgi:hypothetical protein